MRTNDWVGKRKAARQPVNMRGELRFLDGRPPVTCRITDISATGSAIELSEEIPNLDDFDLFIEARSETKFCKVRRADGVRLGVAFLKSRLDDPLVMQTLMERVLRLERGYAEMRGAPILESAEATGERRQGQEPRRTADRELEFAGPSIDQRIQALAAGLSELRGIVDTAVSAPRPDAIKELAPAVEANASDIASLKSEMRDFARALRGAATGDVGNAAPNAIDHSDDIAFLREEFASLSASMREMSASPAMRATPVAASAAPETFTREIAKIRADISELRAAIGTKSVAPAPWLDGGDSATGLQSARPGLRADIDVSREIVRTALPPQAAREIDDLRNAVRTLIVLVSKTLNRLPQAA